MCHKVTVTGLYHADLLHKLRVTIKEKRRGTLTHILLLLHDSVSAHRSHAGQAVLLGSGFEEIILVIQHILLTRHQVIVICFQI